MKIPDYSKKVKQPTYLEMKEEIERLTAESTKWESKFYDEAKKVDKAIEYIEENSFAIHETLKSIVIGEKVLEILKGEDNGTIS